MRCIRQDHWKTTWTDETGYSYFGARYYSPELSVWLGVDPLSDKYPSLSPYNYCALNPVMLVDPDGRQFDDYFDKEGNFLYRDNKSTDNVRIIDRKDWEQIQSEFGQEILDAGTTHKNLDQALESKSTAIQDTKLSGDAVRKIFNHVISSMRELDKSKLYNGSVSTYDYLDSKNTTNNGFATGEASTYITKQGKIRISILMTGGYIPTEFNTISNIQNAIGVHEYLGHGVGRITGDKDHYKAYDLQFSHPTWNRTSEYFKQQMKLRYKDYK